MSPENEKAQNCLRKSCVAQGEGPTKNGSGAARRKKIRASFLKKGDLVFFSSHFIKRDVRILVVDKVQNPSVPSCSLLTLWIFKDEEVEKTVLNVNPAFILCSEGVRVRGERC
jgi:hypothetical protein